MRFKIPERIRPENHRFYSITQIAYIVGAVGHLGAGFRFWRLGVVEMVWVNALFSVPAFVLAFFLNRRGRHNIAFALAFFELLLHQILGVYYIGWHSGLYFWLIYLIGISFFNANWSMKTRFTCFSVVYCTFILLYLFFETPGVYQLTQSQYTLLYLSSSATALLILALLINYFVQAAGKAENQLKAANRELSGKNTQIQATLMERDQAFKRLEKEQKKSEEMAGLLKKMFGRYLSADVMNALLEDPSTLELGGEKRQVTIMMTDLRGFTALCERMKPEQVVRMLNTYFEIMMEIIDTYQGTVNEIIGDALLVVFGAPQQMPDRIGRAIACAIEMQNAMAAVNERNRTSGLPELEMGIGLNETEVIVGNIGSDKRSKYAVVGSGVNQTSRIESYTVGGQILISGSVYEAAGHDLRIDAQRDVFPKGSETPLRIYAVGGIAGTWNLALSRTMPPRVLLKKEMPLRYKPLASKDVRQSEYIGSILKLSNTDAEMKLADPADLLSNIKMNLVDVAENLSTKHFYGKIMAASQKSENAYIIRFTSVPPEVDAYFQAVVSFHA